MGYLGLTPVANQTVKAVPLADPHLGGIMQIKQFAITALVGMAISGAAQAQTWERLDEEGNYLSAMATGTNDASFSFGCRDNVREQDVAEFWITFPAEKVPEDFEDGNVVRAFIDVDGERTEWRLDFMVIGDGDVVGFTSTGDPRLDEEAGSEAQVNLVYALQTGRQATFNIPLLNLSSTLGLEGSMDALRGIYIGCGTRITGTGVID